MLQLEFDTPKKTLAEEIADIVQPAAVDEEEKPFELTDEEVRLFAPAPNAIEWCIRPDYCNATDLYVFARSYQTIRDYFELRCPDCNEGGTDRGQPGDLMPNDRPRTKEYMENEVLLVWNEQYGEDVCPKCHTTRNEFVERGLFQNYNQCHLLAGMRCVALASTYIFSARGLLRLDEVIQKASPGKSQSLDLALADNSYGTASAFEAVYMGKKASKRIVTTYGFDLEVSHDHKLLRVGESEGVEHWIRAEDLVVGDLLKLRVGAGLFGISEFAVPRARLLGAFIGGATMQGQNLVLSHVDPTVLRTLGLDLQALGEGEAFLSEADGEGQETTLCITDQDAIATFYELGLRVTRFENREVPVAIRRSRRESVVAFLSGFLSAIGCACLDPGDDFRQSIGFDFESRALATQVRLLLLNLGVLTSFHETQSEGLFHVVVATESLERLKETVPLLSQRLRNELQDALEIYLARGPTRTNNAFRLVRIQKIEDGEAEMGDLFVPATSSYVANGLVSHNSGKSMTGALIGSYMEHRIYTIAHSTYGGFHKYMGITAAEQFEITFLASNEVQSKNTIWAKYTGFRLNAPWFRRYVPYLKRKMKEQPRYGMRTWSYDEASNFITNEHPSVRLVINSLNSNSAGQAGRTRIAGFVDELARMKQTDSAQSAMEIYRTVEASLQTIRSRTKETGALPWFGSMVSVSSPISRDDQAMKLLRKAPMIRDMYARKYATWEFNPKEPRKNFDSAYAKDPIGAERDFGGNPAGAEHPLVHDEVRWAELVIDPDLSPRAIFEKYTRQDGQGHHYVGVRLARATMHFDGRPRYIVFDAGLNFDAFAGACAHGEVMRDDDGNEKLVTVYDWVIRVVPPVGMEVLFAFVPDIIKDLRGFFPIASVEFDRWNSPPLIQDIRNLGLAAERRSLDNQDFIDWMTACYAGLVRMLPPHPDEAEHAIDPSDDAIVYKLPFVWTKEPPDLSGAASSIYELCSLQRDPDTNKISNPRKGERRGHNSDDCAQVMVHAHKLVQIESTGYTERYDDRSSRANRRRAAATGANFESRGGVYSPPAGVRAAGALGAVGAAALGMSGPITGGLRGSGGGKRGW